MIRDCREDRAAGWTHLIRRHAPVIRHLLARYYPGRAGADLAGRALLSLRRPGSPLYRIGGPATEREFVVELRQAVLQAAEDSPGAAEPEILLDLETLSAALQPLTVIERQMVWLETMSYPAEDAGRLLQASAATVGRTRERAAEMLRQKMDRWRIAVIAENGSVLGKLAGAARGEKCLPVRYFFDAIDGRITWAVKQAGEAHLIECWHCIDHFCRVREADDALRAATPLSPSEEAVFRRVLRLDEDKPSLWKRLFKPER